MKIHLTWQRPAAACALFAGVLLVTTVVSATPTQEEFLKSIQDNVSQSTDPRKVLAFLVGAAAVVILLAVFSQWRKREVAPRVLNHQGKLMKELSSSIDLKTAEIKQLKSLAEDQDVISPLTLMLCPSLLAKAVKDSPGKVDRATVLQIARKIGNG
jgi:hypothetical protein